MFFFGVGVVRGDEIKLATWNLDWFPGKGPTSTHIQRVLHTSEARDALLDLAPDVLFPLEVRDYEAVDQLSAVLPLLQIQVVSRNREAVGGALGIQQTAICAKVGAESAWTESWKRGKVDPPRGFAFSAMRTRSGGYLNQSGMVWRGLGYRAGHIYIPRWVISQVW